MNPHDDYQLWVIWNAISKEWALVATSSNLEAIKEIRDRLKPLTYEVSIIPTLKEIS